MCIVIYKFVFLYIVKEDNVYKVNEKLSVPTIYSLPVNFLLIGTNSKITM